MLIKCGAPGVNRTPGQWFRKPLLYPLSYGGKFVFITGYYATKKIVYDKLAWGKYRESLYYILLAK